MCVSNPQFIRLSQAALESSHLSRQPPSLPASQFTVCTSRFTRPRFIQKSFRNLNPYSSRRKYCSTPPICTAVRSPFVSPYFPGFYASKKKGEPCNTPPSTPPICTAVRSPFVRQYFGENTGVGVTGTFLIYHPGRNYYNIIP